MGCSRPVPPPPNIIPGQPAWKADLPAGARVVKIEDDGASEPLRFDHDLKEKIVLHDGNPGLDLVVLDADGRTTTVRLTAGDVGIAPPDKGDDEAGAAIAKAIAFLLSKQSEDGGLKSEAYGVLRSGAAMTALMLYAVSHAPDDATAPHREQLDKAFAFLKRGIDKTGTVAAPDGTLDYPTYGCALVLLADARLKLDISAADRDRLTQWIIDNQLGERHEVPADSIQFGGWDLEAASGAKGDQLKGTNISISSFALEALSASMHKDAPAAVRRARGWVEGCQNDDGGFVFHPWRPHPGNKAMWNDDPQSDAISYATPTCDGLRALSYCGFKPDDEHVKSTLKWLADHPDVKHVPGFEKEASDLGWREGLRFYFYFTQAKALPVLPEEEARRRAVEIRKVLLAEQRADGRFQNKTARMFEDDPLLATSLAIIALCEVRAMWEPTPVGD